MGNDLKTLCLQEDDFEIGEEDRDYEVTWPIGI